MIGLDNAATSGRKPPQVLAAVRDALLQPGNPGRGGHEAADRAARTVYDCREQAAAMFGAEPRQVVFTMNCTHGLNLAVGTLVRPGDRVVVTGFEHNAVLRPLYRLGADTVPVRCPVFDRDACLERFESALTARTGAAVVCHVSNVFGMIQPLEEMADLCRRRGIPLIVDAAQSAGLLPLSLEKLGAAFIAMPGHKGLYGPMGTGLVLCGRVPEPLLCGGTGSLSRSAEMPPDLPDRAEAGTQNVPGIAGLLEGLRFVDRQGSAALLQREQGLKDRLVRRLSCLPGLTLWAHETAQTGVLSFLAENAGVHALADRLSALGFAVRSGLHCAPMAHETAGTLKTGTVRVSFSAFSTEQETDAFADAVASLL